MIFIIRLLTATCFFALLAKANIWLTPICNAILAIGYRTFLIFSPVMSKYSRGFAISVSLLFSFVGMLLFLFNSESLLILGAILLGIGISVSGYLIRSEAAETASGAAHNKIAANLGSFFAGLILLFPAISKMQFFTLNTLIIFVALVIAFSIDKRPRKINLALPKNTSLSRMLGWILLGMALGIKLFSVFSVLPQCLLSYDNHLPNWYGMMIFANGFTIILLQLPIIHLIERMGLHKATIVTLGIMLFGMVLIAFPRLLHVYYFANALLWVISLSLVECVASYLDVRGAQSGCLLIKELSVGVGAGVTVLVSRVVPQAYSSISLGVVGALCILIAYFLLRKDLE